MHIRLLTIFKICGIILFVADGGIFIGIFIGRQAKIRLYGYISFLIREMGQWTTTHEVGCKTAYLFAGIVR